MSFLTAHIKSEENLQAIANIPSHLFLSLVSVVFCAIGSFGNLGNLIFCVIIGVTATFYALQTLAAKRNLDYEDAVRYSRLAKTWAIAAYILGVLCSLAQFI